MKSREGQACAGAIIHFSLISDASELTAQRRFPEMLTVSNSGSSANQTGRRLLERNKAQTTPEL